MNEMKGFFISLYILLYIKALNHPFSFKAHRLKERATIPPHDLVSIGRFVFMSFKALQLFFKMLSIFFRMLHFVRNTFPANHLSGLNECGQGKDAPNDPV